MMTKKEYKTLSENLASTKKILMEFVEFATEKFHSLEETKVDRADLDEAVKKGVEAGMGKFTDQILTAVDAYAKKADAYFQEHILLAGQVDRHEKWHHQTAKKLGMKLDS